MHNNQYIANAIFCRYICETSIELEAIYFYSTHTCVLLAFKNHPHLFVAGNGNLLEEQK